MALSNQEMLAAKARKEAADAKEEARLVALMMAKFAKDEANERAVSPSRCFRSQLELRGLVASIVRYFRVKSDACKTKRHINERYQNKRRFGVSCMKKNEVSSWIQWPTSKKTRITKRCE